MLLAIVFSLSLIHQIPLSDAFLLPHTTRTFLPLPSRPVLAGRLSATTTTSSINLDPTFTPPDIAGEGEIGEVAAAEAASLMKRAIVPVPTYVSPKGTVGISYIHWEAAATTTTNEDTLPLILLHGFDSSCLEYRRLGPKLAALGIDVYAIDLLGWGYTQLRPDITSFSARAKVDALTGFWNTVGGGRPVCIAGASLGGAAAIEFSVERSDIVKGVVLIDAQGFVDGVGPMAMLPMPLARLGVGVLKSVPLRNSANKMSYFDVEKYATEDALKIGRFHCLREGWNDALVNFMLSGGFAPAEKVEKIEAPGLILWGRQDGILEKEFAQKFVDTMPRAELKWIEECGHVPHLEQPEETAKAIESFLRSDRF